MKYLLIVILMLTGAGSFAQFDSCSLVKIGFGIDTVDSGSLNLTIDGHGGVALDTNRFGEANQASRFDGVNDYFVLNNDSAFLDSLPITITIWARIDGEGGGANNQNMLFSHRDDQAGGGQSIINMYGQNGVDDVECVVRGHLTTLGTRPNRNGSPSYGEWHMYSLVIAEDSISGYLDCELYDRLPNTQQGSFDQSIDYVRVGMHRFNGGDKGFMNGLIDDLTIYNCALDSIDICNLYEGTPGIGIDTNDTSINDTIIIDTLPQGGLYDSCLIVNIDMDSVLVDSGVHGYNVHAFGGSADTNRFGHPNKSWNFDGVDDYIQLNYDNDILENGPLTITMWSRIDGPGGGGNAQNMLFSHRDDQASGGASIVNMYGNNGAGNVECVVRGSLSSNGTRPSRNGSPNYGGWHMYTLVIDNDSISGYLDCELYDRLPNTQSGTFDQSIDYVRLGMHRFNGIDQGYLNGSMDNFRIYDCPFTSDDVCELFNDSTEYYNYVSDTTSGDTVVNDTLPSDTIGSSSIQELNGYVGQIDVSYLGSESYHVQTEIPITRAVIYDARGVLVLEAVVTSSKFQLKSHSVGLYVVKFKGVYGEDVGWSKVIHMK